jgi:hypothetical protein
MSFWKKLFGGKQSANTGLTERQAGHDKGLTETSKLLAENRNPSQSTRLTDRGWTSEVFAFDLITSDEREEQDFRQMADLEEIPTLEPLAKFLLSAVLC